ncbi:hypothetical protein QQP08_015374 [Theobroma cacao]|nr:hypothetical protein QQP08_015374 [Theobroma cacao]
MHLTSQPIGQETAAMPMQTTHCFQSNLSVLANFFRNSTITACRTKIPCIELIKDLTENKCIEYQGCSVAKASAPKVSIMRFTHNSWTAVSGTSPEDTAATKLMTKAATFTTHRPHLKTVATEVKLSSKMTISELSFATSVP